MNDTTSQTYLGLDGGGTGCRLAICDRSGRRLAEARGGAANYTSDPDATVRNLRAAIAAAAQEAGLDPAGLASCVAHLGLAGIMDAAQAATLAAAMPCDRITVTDDRPTTAAGALGDRDGAVAAVGTGSFVAVRRGESLRHFGGWGLRLGDQASGAWLGRSVLERCLLVRDGLAIASALTTALWQRFEDTPARMVAFGATAGPGALAEFAPLVIDAAASGDTQGRALMQAGAKYIESCLAAADLHADEVLCLTGGIGPHYAEYLTPETRQRLCPPQGSALDGALALARAALDGDIAR
mgnify:FL=1